MSLLVPTRVFFKLLIARQTLSMMLMREIIFTANEICVTIVYDIGYTHYVVGKLLDVVHWYSNF